MGSARPRLPPHWSPHTQRATGGGGGSERAETANFWFLPLAGRLQSSTGPLVIVIITKTTYCETVMYPLTLITKAGSYFYPIHLQAGSAGYVGM